MEKAVHEPLRRNVSKKRFMNRPTVQDSKREGMAGNDPSQSMVFFS